MPILGSTTVRLAIDQYQGINGTKTPLNVSFILSVTEWNTKIETGAVVIGVGLYNMLGFPLNYVKMNMTVKGVISDIGHEPHPLVSDVDHHPDVVDMEEAALLFNQIGIAEHKVRLEVPFPAGVRQYEGVIESMAIINPPGTAFTEYILKFSVSWNPSFPTIRGWNDE